MTGQRKKDTKGLWNKQKFPYLHKHLSDHHIIVVLKYRAEHNCDTVLLCLNIPAGRQVQSTSWPGDHTQSQPIARTDGDGEETATQAWMPPRSRTAYSTAKTFLQMTDTQRQKPAEKPWVNPIRYHVEI
ncbi:hypothetical protein DV515_00005583 [Chloebia gouldiae]|uniref:Uncharacterized protein n=1 Tax=Chloebia gouldiae TaxID=44316 RepID=A0A3L8SMJ7_CHLGU|nr:hypothetical protein DV515_00005583 [Chloebia gouldiae]